MPGSSPGMTEMTNNRSSYPFFFGSHFSTGPPASRQAAKPPPICATGFRPMSCAVLAASAERKAAGAVENELLVFLEDRLGIGALRIDPEFQHAAGAGERAGDLAVALDLAGVADVDDDDVGSAPP